MDSWMVETTLSERYPFYTRANVGEVFPDPVCPATFSFGFHDGTSIGGSEKGFRDAYVRMGAFDADEFPPDECVFLGVVGGYAYLNASALRILGHRAPGMTAKDIDDAFFGDAPGVPPFVAQPGDDRPDLTEKLAATFGWVLTTDSLPEVAADEVAMNELRAKRPDLTKLSDQQIYDLAWSTIDEHFHRLFSQHIYISFLGTLPMGIIAGTCAAVGRPEATLALIAGLGDVESAAPSMAMWELGRAAAASATVNRMFRSGTEDLDERLRASSDPDAKAFVQKFDEFLFKYGSRGPNEWESRSPTWETQPSLALAAIDRMRISPESSSPFGHNTERHDERERLGAEIAAMLEGNPEAQGQFLAALHSSTVFMPGRERTKTNCVKLIQELRVMLREWGKRMVAAGVFPKVESYGMVTRTEAQQIIDNPSKDWFAILEDRERAYDQVKQLEPPFLFVGRPPAMSTYPRRDAYKVAAATVGEVLQGVPGCSGVYQGRARVVLDSHDPTALEPGDVLVAPITDPSWTPLFVPAGAVVVDVGAPLSHAIIVSRELGIPCAVSVLDATRRIPDGALIEVNGTTGQVTVLELP